jgi:hypothetical protein
MNTRAIVNQRQLHGGDALWLLVSTHAMESLPGDPGRTPMMQMQLLCEAVASSNRIEAVQQLHVAVCACSAGFNTVKLPFSFQALKVIWQNPQACVS